MFYILCTAIVLLPVFWGIGAWIRCFFRLPLSASWEITAGMMTVSIIWTVISFFFPLNLTVEWITVLIGILGFFRGRKYQLLYPFFSEHWKIFVPFSLFAFFSGSFYPFILDFFGYYLPTVRWLSEAGMVKGISNLDLLLGQMSLWHVLQAGFSGFSDPFLRLNSLVVVVFLIYILEKKNFAYLLFLPLFLLYTQSPSPDLPVMVFSLMVLGELFSGSRNLKFLFLFAVYVFVIKPTMLWLPLLVMLYGCVVLKKYLGFLLPGLLLAGLFVVKNLWTFGYPVFPIVAFDVGIPWKPNAEIMEISHQIGVQKTFDMQYSYSEIQKFGVAEYFFRWLFLKGIKSLIHISFVVSLIGFSIYSFCIRKKIVFLVLISVLIKSTLILVFSAQYRFFIDVFLVMVFVVLYPYQKKGNKVFVPLSFAAILLVTLMLAFPNLLKKAVPSFRPGSFMYGFEGKQMFKPSEYKWGKYTTYRIGNLKFNMVEGYPYSFDTPLPAISPEFVKEDLDAGIFPQKNSIQLKNGFFWRTISEKEKQKLEEILSERKRNFERK